MNVVQDIINSFTILLQAIAWISLCMITKCKAINKLLYILLKDSSSSYPMIRYTNFYANHFLKPQTELLRFSFAVACYIYFLFTIGSGMLVYKS